MDVNKVRELARVAGLDINVQPGGRGTPFLCSCGCGQKVRYTKKSWSKFVPGHDSRLVSKLLQACRDKEIDINDATALVEEEFSPGLANKLMRTWEGNARVRTRTCPVTSRCGKPPLPGDPKGRCAEHAPDRAAPRTDRGRA